jgi:[acyl-carrier-protein] S-malonyltransferase
MSPSAEPRGTSPRTAVLFPGQGSHTPGMRQTVDRICPELANRAVSAIGEDPFMKAGEATCYAQPAIFCASVAGWRSIEQRVRPTVVAGHSLGEFGALVAAGVLDAMDALRLVIRRGELMQHAHERAQGGMVAVSGPKLAAVDSLASKFGVVVANDNAPGQLVLSGRIEMLHAITAELRARGLRVARLPVGGAFHSSLMADVAVSFRPALADIETKAPICEAMCTTTVAPFGDVVDDLVMGITRPVRWRQSIERLHEEGIERFIEVGPGRVLTRLVRRTLGDETSALTASEVLSGHDP